MPEQILVRCSFCGRTESQTETLVVANLVAICDRCIDACRAVVEERRLLAACAGQGSPLASASC